MGLRTRVKFYLAILTDKQRNLFNYKTVEPRELNFGLNIKINKSVMYANFGDTRSRDRELRLQKPGKTAIFVSKIYLFAYNTRKAEIWLQRG